MTNGCRLSTEDKRRIARLIDEGWGCNKIADEYGVCCSAAKQWIRTYKAVGLDGLLGMGTVQRKYSYETKLAAARAVVDEGLTHVEAMAAFDLANDSILRRWCKAYRDGGAEALKPKKKGRKKGGRNRPKSPAKDAAGKPLNETPSPRLAD